jgi:hypothetical protein
MIGRLLNNKVERMWNEVSVPCYKALSINYRGGLRKTSQNLSIIHISIEIRSEYIITVTWYMDLRR